MPASRPIRRTPASNRVPRIPVNWGGSFGGRPDFFEGLTWQREKVARVDAAAERQGVPCGTCNACCRNQMILLTKYDDVKSYAARVVRHPVNGKPLWALQQLKNGDCVYLGKDGCTIHDRAPYLCRQFDCRAIYREMLDVGSDADIDAGIKAGLTSREIITAARERTHA